MLTVAANGSPNFGLSKYSTFNFDDSSNFPYCNSIVLIFSSEIFTMKGYEKRPKWKRRPEHLGELV